MASLVVRKHRQDILSRFAMALSHQEVSLLPEELLGFGARDGAVIPLLLSQGALRGWDHIKELLAGASRVKKVVTFVGRKRFYTKFKGTFLQL